MSMITELVERLRESADNTELDMECSLNCDGECNKLLREAAGVIEELSTKLQSSNMDRSSQYYNGGWIPVSERLPDKNGRYLVTVKQGYITLGIWVGEAKLWAEVIAWMPLPQPYKEDEE